MRFSVENDADAHIAIAPAPITWDLPRSCEGNRRETSARRKCCSIVSQKRMRVRRFRNRYRAAGVRDAAATRGRVKKKFALIFGVLALVADCRLLAFEAL
jgi:hypothetical protein